MLRSGGGGGAAAPLTLTETVGASALTLTGATQTASFPVLSATQTWNNAGVTFSGWKLNITNTASAAASTLIDLQVGAASKFNVDRSGILYIGGGNVGLKINGGNSPTFGNVSANYYVFGSNIPMQVTSSGGYGISSNASIADAAANDVIWTRSAAGVWQAGDANSAAPVAQTLRAQGSRADIDTNVGGANYTVTSGNGTGTGTISSLILQSPVAVGSGTGAQTMTTGLTPMTWPLPR